MQVSFFKEIFTYIVEILNIAGISIVILGILYSTIHYFSSFSLLTKPKSHTMDLSRLRSEISNSILLGLDFMVGATVVESVISPS